MKEIVEVRGEALVKMYKDSLVNDLVAGLNWSYGDLVETYNLEDETYEVSSEKSIFVITEVTGEVVTHRFLNETVESPLRILQGDSFKEFKNFITLFRSWIFRDCHQP